MDNKKKLEAAYIPDKKTQKEKVVIGLSGGIDSYVMAYLLKIQKYELMAVTVVNSWEDYLGDASKILSCQLNQAKLDEIKEFCHKLGISHRMVKEASKFKENVIEPWMADKILGRYPTQCWDCHDLRLLALHKTMIELGAKHMATGHLAKLFQNESHGTVYVHTSNDEENDQSALLSRLPHDVLKSMLLPLADLSKKEILKLAENFGVSESPDKLQMHECLPWNEELRTVFEKMVPKKLLEGGDIVNEDSTQVFGKHEGVYLHSYGEKLELREGSRSLNGHFGKFNYADKKIVMLNEEAFKHKDLLLVHCHFSEELSLAEPFKGFLMLKDGSFLECWIHPKTLSSVYLELNEKNSLLNGEIV
jgi:tRNA-uridine 2-sulfurtransferase